MNVLNDKSLLDYYLDKYEIDKIFEKNMKEWMELHHFSKNEKIYTIDETPDYFYFLVKGKLKIYFLGENGKKLLLRFSKPLGIHGDIELMGDYQVKTNVEAVNETILIGIKRSNINAHALDDVKFLRYVIKNLSLKLYSVSTSASLNLSYPLENRLASYLISITSNEHNEKRIDEIKTSNLEELSELLGTSYRHLNRVLKEFSNQRLIKRNKNELIILDFEALKSLSAGMYE